MDIPNTDALSCRIYDFHIAHLSSQNERGARLDN
jgi:hypothetical protein